MCTAVVVRLHRTLTFAFPSILLSCDSHVTHTSQYKKPANQSKRMGVGKTMSLMQDRSLLMAANTPPLKCDHPSLPLTTAVHRKQEPKARQWWPEVSFNQYPGSGGGWRGGGRGFGYDEDVSAHEKIQARGEPSPLTPSVKVRGKQSCGHVLQRTARTHVVSLQLLSCLINSDTVHILLPFIFYFHFHFSPTGPTLMSSLRRYQPRASQV